MKKTEIPNIVASKTGYTIRDVRNVLAATEKVVYDALERNEEVHLFSGLLLYIKHIKPKKYNDPNSDGTLMVDERFKPKARFSQYATFKINKAIKKNINKGIIDIDRDTVDINKDNVEE